MTGTTDSTPSIFLSQSTYFVLRFAVVAFAWNDPGRVKIISARTFDERRCKSSDIPRDKPVNNITRVTPSATPSTLIAERRGRWRMFDMTRLSTERGPLSQTGNINTCREESLTGCLTIWCGILLAGC